MSLNSLPKSPDCDGHNNDDSSNVTDLTRKIVHCTDKVQEKCRKFNFSGVRDLVIYAGFFVRSNKLSILAFANLLKTKHSGRQRANLLQKGQGGKTDLHLRCSLNAIQRLLPNHYRKSASSAGRGLYV